MKLSELKIAVDRLCVRDGDSEVRIPIQLVDSVMLGRYPSVEVTGIHAGFDWDSGTVFISPETKLTNAGDEFEKEKKRARETSETLGWVWYVVRGSLSDAEKIKELKKMLKSSVEGKRSKKNEPVAQR